MLVSVHVSEKKDTAIERTNHKSAVRAYAAINISSAAFKDRQSKSQISSLYLKIKKKICQLKQQKLAISS